MTANAATPAPAAPAPPRAEVTAALVIDDPVILPMRNRDRADRRFWFLLSASILIAVALAAALRLAL